MVCYTNEQDEQQLTLYDEFYNKLKNSFPHFFSPLHNFQKLLKVKLTEKQSRIQLASKTKPKSKTKHKPNLAIMCLHKSKDFEFYLCFSSELRQKKLLEKTTGRYEWHSSTCFCKEEGNQTFSVNQPLGLMPVNSILVLCVRICPQDCVQNGATMKKHKVQRNSKVSSYIW